MWTLRCQGWWLTVIRFKGWVLFIYGRLVGLHSFYSLNKLNHQNFWTQEGGKMLSQHCNCHQNLLYAFNRRKLDQLCASFFWGLCLGPAPVFSLAMMTKNIVTVLSAEIPLTDAPAYNTKSFKSSLLLSSEWFPQQCYFLIWTLQVRAHLRMISADGLMLAMDRASGRGSEPVTTLSHPLITLQTQVAVIE